MCVYVSMYICTYIHRLSMLLCFQKVVTAGMAVKVERLTVFKNVPYGMRLKEPLTTEVQFLAFSWRRSLERTGEGVKGELLAP